ELAAVRAVLDDAAQQPVGTAAQIGDLGVVVGAQGLEFVLDDPGGGVVLGVPAGEGTDRVGEPLGGAALGLGGGTHDAQRLFVADAADAVEQLFLGLVVDVERGGAHAGPAGDVAGGGGVVAALGERRDRRADQPSRGV